MAETYPTEASGIRAGDVIHYGNADVTATGDAHADGTPNGIAVETNMGTVYFWSTSTVSITRSN